MFGRKVITMKIRLEYLKKVFEDTSGQKISFPEFMECLFTKLEEEIRSGKSGLEKLYKAGEGKTLPVSNQATIFKYDYDR